MTDFHDWLGRVLDRGASARPPLGGAGPPVPFDPDIVLEAAVVLARACWALVAAEPVAVEFGAEPSSASAHLSADVALRLLPGVYRRGPARGPARGQAAPVERN